MRRAAIILAALLLGAAPRPGAIPPAGSEVRFEAIDVFVDPRDEPLGAYEVVFRDRPGDDVTLTLVGVEGGEHPAYREPPAYDPAALHAEPARVVLAAFSTLDADELPRTRTRVARLHVQVQAPPGRTVSPDSFTLELAVAGDAQSRAIDAAAGAMLRRHEPEPPAGD